MHVVCPHCDAVNRVPPERPARAARCGRCKEPLFTGQPVEVDAARLRRHVEKGDLPVLVDLWAPWCGPCKMMAPAFVEAARTLEPEVRLLKANTEAHPDLAVHLGVQSIPTLVLFRGGREVARRSGALPAQQIVDWTRQHLRQAA